MRMPRALSLVIFLIAVVAVPSGIGRAAVVDPFPVCIGLKSSGLGARHVDLTLIAFAAGTFFQLNGQAVFSQPIGPPSSVVVYGVARTALRTVDGFFVSLTGAGTDLAQNVFNGTFALQLSADPAKNTLTYSKRSLDGTSNTVLTGAAEVATCP